MVVEMLDRLGIVVIVLAIFFLFFRGRRWRLLLFDEVLAVQWAGSMKSKPRCYTL